MKLIGVTRGMRGYFAVLYIEADGPIQTGIGSYKTEEEARVEAREWARSEGLRCDWEVKP